MLVVLASCSVTSLARLCSSLRVSRGYRSNFTPEGKNSSSSVSASSGREELVFSAFNPKHSPLMLDANSLNFPPTGKNPEFCSRKVLCPSSDQRPGLANCFAAFLPSQVSVACYNSGLCSLQCPFLQDGAKPSDTGLQGGDADSAGEVWGPQLPLGHNQLKQSLGCSGYPVAGTKGGLGTLLC